jgi:hypothetical protein
MLGDPRLALIGATLPDGERLIDDPGAGALAMVHGQFIVGQPERSLPIDRRQLTGVTERDHLVHPFKEMIAHLALHHAGFIHQDQAAFIAVVDPIDAPGGLAVFVQDGEGVKISEWIVLAGRPTFSAILTAALLVGATKSACELRSVSSASKLILPVPASPCRT